MTNTQEFITHSAEETQKVGETFAKQVRNAGVICLYGNLGFGKTTFVQGFARGLGIERRIISPTFIIIRRYKIKNHISKRFYHIDLYRMESLNDLEGLGIKEIFEDLNAVVVIEWAEKAKELLPENRWEVRFEYAGENERRIVICHLFEPEMLRAEGLNA